MINAPVRLFQATITINCKFWKNDGRKIPGGDRGGGHVSEVIPQAFASLARLFVSSCLTK
jgi:hypothetical protein